LGNLVFESDKPNGYRDGAAGDIDSPQRVYSYAFRYRLAQGKKEFASGYVQLLR
jgi:hypothetical protein